MSTLAFNFAKEIVERLKARGFEAYFAGGCVRDKILNRASVDYDIATSALADEVREIFPRTVPVGEAFQVVIVLSEDEKPQKVEVATFRKDIGIADGRRPMSVERATAREDVERRDFTINGMLYDPIEDKILDWVGGEADLKKKILRAIGDPELRIDEDHLRMLRAIRFSSRFDFEIETSLFKAIKQKASLITKISSERIFEEVSKMLNGPHADLSFERMAETGLLKEILPEALAMKGVEQPPEFHPEGDVWTHTMLLLKQCAGTRAELAWGCLLHDIGKPPTFTHEPGDRIRFNNHENVGIDIAKAIMKRMKASNHFSDLVLELIHESQKFKDVMKMRPSTLKRFLRNPNFDLHLQMHRIDCMACHQDMTIFNFCNEQIANLPAEILRPTPLINGDDLIVLGLKPGRLFKDILEAVETEQLEGRISSKDEALNFTKKNFATHF